jgi:hypothetical protein
MFGLCRLIVARMAALEGSLGARTLLSMIVITERGSPPRATRRSVAPAQAARYAGCGTSIE